ncbi:ylmG homolog protein 1-2, chloroplastic-like [Miscanthus floridulus]|uniref:ylmG homolog protein 1-2, chloroplastic-like n=1 Tax=Miscanthus floridulus TaxID=154761 RepID=UPI00345A2935
MYGILTSPCPRAPLLRALPSPSARAFPRTLALPARPLPRGLRLTRPRAAAEASASAAATALGGLLASPLSTLEAALRGLNLAPLRAPVAAAMSAAVRWLGVYREVLLVGVLLSWFPNIPWDRQPFSALRDLCDPFLALCREVMPPVFGRKLDLSPLVAFMAIDIIIMILRPQPRM